MAQDRQLKEFLKNAVDPMLKGPDDKVMLLSCIDLRFPDRIIEAMDALGYRGKYYHLAMAGASHAAKHSSAWTTAFEDHLDFTLVHGHVKGLIIFDHMDCAAYHHFEGTSPSDPAGERQKHIDILKMVTAAVLKKHPKLATHIYGYLLPKELVEEIVHI
jgi:carbonic anhydrase